MANETEFVNGLIFKAPNNNAPEYVKAKGSIKREELIAWLQTRGGEWVNFDVKVSSGKVVCGGGQLEAERQRHAPAQRAEAGQAGCAGR